MSNNMWTDTMIKELESMYPFHPNRDIADRLGIAENLVRNKAKVLKLHKIIKDFGGSNRWKRHEDQFLKDNYFIMTSTQIGKELGRTRSAVKNRTHVLGLRLPEEFKTPDRCQQYKKGSIPQNKGKKMSPELRERCKHTWYQKGHKPHNTKENGAITKRASGYLFIRLEESVWEFLHIHNWIEAGNEIPKGMNLVFKDGNKENCAVENLELITNEELMARNTISQYPPELKTSILLRNKVSRKLKSLQDGKK